MRFVGLLAVKIEAVVRSIVNCQPETMQRKRQMRLIIDSPSPTTFKNPSDISPREKKHPSSPSPSFPLPYHPLPPSSHRSPSPYSRILLYKPGTDVCRGRAERPRCSGCQPHAFHSEMKAHSSPSCEANFPPKKKKKRGGVEKNKLSKCLQVPSKSDTYVCV